MKEVLLLGLGNDLMGDDGAGLAVADLLAVDPRLPPGVEVVRGGTDLLRWNDAIQGCRRVLIIDAILANSDPGTVEIFQAPFEGLSPRQSSAHHLSVAQSIAMMQAADPRLRETRFVVVGVSVGSVEFRAELSPALAVRLPDVVDRVLAILREKKVSSPEQSPEQSQEPSPRKTTARVV
jgi:hydrogenase maturation protease